VIYSNCVKILGDFQVYRCAGGNTGFWGNKRGTRVRSFVLGMGAGQKEAEEGETNYVHCGNLEFYEKRAN